MLGTTFFQLLSLSFCLFMSQSASLCPLSLGLRCFSQLCTFVFFGLFSPLCTFVTFGFSSLLCTSVSFGLFLTTMHLCDLWFFLTTMHLCVLWVIPHHYAPLCFFLTTMHLCVFSSPLCTFVFFVTFSVLFVTYVCCVCVCVCLVKLLSFNISHVDLSNTPEPVFDSSNSSHCGPPPPQLSAQPSTRV